MIKLSHFSSSLVAAASVMADVDFDVDSLVIFKIHIFIWSSSICQQLVK